MNVIATAKLSIYTLLGKIADKNCMRRTLLLVLFHYRLNRDWLELAGAGGLATTNFLRGYTQCTERQLPMHRLFPWSCSLDAV